MPPEGPPVATVAGAALLIGLIALVLVAVVWDVFNEIRGQPTIDQRLQSWSAHFPLVAGFLVLLLGAFLSHLFWQPPNPSP